MPIQNIGTLLENIVLLEAARVLTSRTAERLALVNAFAMPPLSPWRDGVKYEYQVGFTDHVLEHVATLSTAPTTSYIALLQRCLQHDRALGPSGGLLVALLALLNKHDVVMWLNDIADPHAHYPGTIGKLQDFPNVLAAVIDGPSLAEAPSVSDVCYPASLQEMSRAVSQWPSRSIGAVLGFLDPNLYNRDAREGPQTSRKDHREWLERLRPMAAPTLAVHFTAKRTTNDLLADIASLHSDGASAAYPHTRAFKHSHYVVSVNAFHPQGEDAANELLVSLDEAVFGAWREWYRTAVQRPNGPASLRRFVDGNEAALCELDATDVEGLGP